VKAKGTRLGNRKNLADAQRRDAETNRAAADEFAARVLPVIRGCCSGWSARRTAAELNERGITTARGGQWHASTCRAAAVGDADGL